MSAEPTKTTPATADDSTKSGAGDQQRSGNKSYKPKKPKNQQNNATAAPSTFKGKIPSLGAFVISTNPMETKANIMAVDKNIRDHLGQTMLPETMTSIDDGKLVKLDEYDAKMSDDNKEFADAKEKIKYELREKQNQETTAKIKTELNNAWYVYRGQCSPGINDALKELDDYKDMKDKKCVLKLREMLMTLTVSYKQSKSDIKVMVEGLKDFFGLSQRKGEELNDYHKRFISSLKTTRALVGGEGQLEPCIYAYAAVLELYCRENNISDPYALDKDTKKKYLEIQHGKIEAMQFILGADRDIYGGMIEEFDRDYLTGTDRYPTTLHKAYTILRNWHGGKSGRKKKPSDRDTELGVSFNTVGEGDGDEVERSERKQCGRCGRYHRGECTATKHVNGTTLHVQGKMAEMESQGDETFWEKSGEVEHEF